MNNKVTISGNESERVVLHRALQNYHEHARKRYDPDFVPKPGKKDRNIESMRICTELMALCDRAGEFDIATSDDERRVMRNALAALVTSAEAESHEVDAALQLISAIPVIDAPEGVEAGEALVTAQPLSYFRG